jgi:hypothetical protein
MVAEQSMTSNGSAKDKEVQNQVCVILFTVSHYGITVNCNLTPHKRSTLLRNAVMVVFSVSGQRTVSL